MPTENMKVMKALTQKMGWLEENQKSIAQNIANADTPGYRPQELKQPDFKDLLKNTTSSISLSSASPSMARTDMKHFGVNGTTPGDPKVVAKDQKKVYETAPAGNAVVLEEQMLKMSENYTDHRFITNLYQKNIDMLKTSVRTER